MPTNSPKEGSGVSASPTAPLAIVDLLRALAVDCENTDGWEGAAPDCIHAADTITALYEACEAWLAAWGNEADEAAAIRKMEAALALARGEQ